MSRWSRAAGSADTRTPARAKNPARTAKTDEFAEFFAAWFTPARRIAYALCGNWNEAEEIAQTAFVRMYAHWSRVRPETAEAYLRTVVTRTFLDTRRRGRAKEQAVAEVPDSPVASVETQIDERHALFAALHKVPEGQRAVLVLRFVQDMSIEQVAEALRCSAGTVKSQTSRGLVALRIAYFEVAGQPLELRAVARLG
jgi:RNA polymerase sigma-70 factor (sigma-E family)